MGNSRSKGKRGERKAAELLSDNDYNVRNNFIDITGQSFNKLKVIKRVENNNYGNAQWLCKCLCGEEKVFQGTHLRSGKPQSCGCSAIKSMAQKNTKHGMSRSKGYKAYRAVLQRCNNPKSKAYKYYGGRGIKICDRWLESFENFWEDMGEEHRDTLTLDRINNNGNYEPSNCRWATRKMQQNNRRANFFITYKDETLTIAEWADKLNIGFGTLAHRIKYAQWPIAKALETPVKLYNYRKESV
jgi:hypothetical protein